MLAIFWFPRKLMLSKAQGKDFIAKIIKPFFYAVLATALH